MQYICPTCGKPAVQSERAVGTDHNFKMNKRPPGPGDLTICVHCSELLQFDEAMDLVMPSLDTLTNLPQIQSDMIDVAQQKIRNGESHSEPPKPGDRVGAVLEACMKTGVIHFIGYGVYDGDHVPPAEIKQSTGVPNPMLKLDNGQIVWACECWWILEPEMKEIMGHFRKVITVDMEKERNRANEQPTKTTGQDAQDEESQTPALNRKRNPIRWKWNK